MKILYSSGLSGSQQGFPCLTPSLSNSATASEIHIKRTSNKWYMYSKYPSVKKLKGFWLWWFFFLIFFYGLQYLSPRLLFSVRVCGRQEELPCSYLTKDIVKWDGTKEEEAKHRGAQTRPTNKKQTWSVTWLIKMECENVILVRSPDWGPWSKWVTRGKRKTLKKKHTETQTYQTCLATREIMKRNKPHLS